MSKVGVFYVPADKMDQYWPTFGPMIGLAQKRLADQCGMDDVEEWLRTGQSLLWGIYVDEKPMAAMMTAESKYPRKRVMVIEMIGGERADLWSKPALDELARVSKASGFDAIETHARAGWSKMAKQYMFKLKHVAYELEL